MKRVMKTAFSITVNSSEFPSIFSEVSLSLFPRLMEMRAAAPAPTSMPSEEVRFITGKVMARPEIASAPTPCPMKIRPITLYIIETTVPIMPGKA